ncbi:MAG: hypothetical protein RLN88_12015 [Ekhidna sp.]|uniref:hypothetical protein n=1 Tax=Ekhidna sp. TaxID=2608089 RepID=UPI0032ECF52D
MGKIGMFLAVSLLMAHTLMPHKHHSNVNDEDHFIEHAQAESLLDYIRLAFHVSPGENHLEEFQTAQGVSLYFPVAEILDFQLSNEILEIEAPKVIFFDAVIEQQFSPDQSNFRGPPQLI